MVAFENWGFILYFQKMVYENKPIFIPFFLFRNFYVQLFDLRSQSWNHFQKSKVELLILDMFFFEVNKVCRFSNNVTVLTLKGKL